MLEETGDLAAMQDMLGQESPDTTRRAPRGRFLHLAQEDCHCSADCVLFRVA
jgi:hypothetical protein